MSMSKTQKVVVLIVTLLTVVLLLLGGYYLLTAREDRGTDMAPGPVGEERSFGNTQI